MSVKERQLDRLPHFYNKEGNNEKLIEIVADELDSVYETNLRTGLWRLDFDEARGRTLDDIGLNLRQYRGTDSDASYRLWLYSKLIAILSRSSISSYNQALELLMRDAYLTMFESWAETFRLNQEVSTGITLNGSETLDGLDWHTEVDEPAAVIIELEQEKFFKEIRDRYLEIAGEEGIEEYLSDILATLGRVREMMSLVKAGGVGIYWDKYVPDITAINPDLDDNAAVIELAAGVPTKFGFGDGGHYTTSPPEGKEIGDPIEPDGNEVAVYGEHSELPIQGENIQNIGEHTVLITQEIARTELNGQTISSIGLYNADDVLVSIKNIHPFLKDEHTRIVFKWRVSGIYFNGVYTFDGTLYFEGAA